MKVMGFVDIYDSSNGVVIRKIAAKFKQNKRFRFDFYGKKGGNHWIKKKKKKETEWRLGKQNGWHRKSLVNLFCCRVQPEILNNKIQPSANGSLEDVIELFL